MRSRVLLWYVFCISGLASISTVDWPRSTRSDLANPAYAGEGHNPSTGTINLASPRPLSGAEGTPTAYGAHSPPAGRPVAHRHFYEEIAECLDIASENETLIELIQHHIPEYGDTCYCDEALCAPLHVCIGDQGSRRCIRTCLTHSECSPLGEICLLFNMGQDQPIAHRADDRGVCGCTSVYACKPLQENWEVELTSCRNEPAAPEDFPVGRCLPDCKKSGDWELFECWCTDDSGAGWVVSIGQYCGGAFESVTSGSELVLPEGYEGYEATNTSCNYHDDCGDTGSCLREQTTSYRITIHSTGICFTASA